MNKFENYVINIINEEINLNPETTINDIYYNIPYLFNIEENTEINNLFNEYKFDIMEYYFDNIEIMKNTNSIQKLLLYCISQIIDNNFYQDEETNTIKEI